MYRRRNDLESLDDRLDAIERQSTRRNPWNLEWRRAPEKQVEHNFSGEEHDEPNDCIITIENEVQRNIGARNKNSSLLNDYSRPTKKNTIRNERQVSFDLRGSPQSIGLFEDVNVEDFEDLEFDSHHRFENDFNIGVRNQDIRHMRIFNASRQELEPHVQNPRNVIAGKQRIYSDNEDDNDQCNDTMQSIKRNTHRPTEKSPKHERAIIGESDRQMGEEMLTNSLAEYLIGRLLEIQEEIANQEGDIEVGEEMLTNGLAEYLIERLLGIQEEMANQEGDIEVQSMKIKAIGKVILREERKRLHERKSQNWPTAQKKKRKESKRKTSCDEECSYQYDLFSYGAQTSGRQKR